MWDLLTKVAAGFSVVIGVCSVSLAETYGTSYGNWCGTPRYDAQVGLDLLGFFVCPVVVSWVIAAKKHPECLGRRILMAGGFAIWLFCWLITHTN